MNKNASLITNIESRITYNEKGSLVHKAYTIVDPGIYIKEKRNRVDGNKKREKQ